MAKKKAKVYNSPGHVQDHPAYNLPAPAGGDHAGTELGTPMGSGAGPSPNPPGASTLGLPPGFIGD